MAEDRPETPARHCAGCGGEMLLATVNNAEVVSRILDACLVANGNEPHNRDSVLTMRDIRKPYCCVRCKYKKEGHAILCVARDSVEERLALLAYRMSLDVP